MNECEFPQWPSSSVSPTKALVLFGGFVFFATLCWMVRPYRQWTSSSQAGPKSTIRFLQWETDFFYTSSAGRVLPFLAGQRQQCISCCIFSLFLEIQITAFRRHRFSQETAGNRRFSQKTAGNCRFSQKPVSPIEFVPSNSALFYTVLALNFQKCRTLTAMEVSKQIPHPLDQCYKFHSE